MTENTKVIVAEAVEAWRRKRLLEQETYFERGMRWWTTTGKMRPEPAPVRSEPNHLETDR